jgi:hypothetical protein
VLRPYMIAAERGVLRRCAKIKIPQIPRGETDA